MHNCIFLPLNKTATQNLKYFYKWGEIGAVLYHFLEEKKQFYEFRLAFLFSHGKHMLGTNLYTDMHVHILPALHLFIY